MANFVSQSLENNETVTALNSDYESGETDSTVSHLVKTIYGYTCAVIFPIGVLLNMLCIIILVRIKMYQTSVGIHLVCIAVIDLITITTAFVYSYPLQEVLKIPQNRYWGNIICRLSAAFTYPVTSASSLLILSATIERFLSIAFPLSVRQWPMLKISKFCVGSIMLLAIAECTIWSAVYNDTYCWYVYGEENIVRAIYYKIYVVIFATTAILVFIFTILTAIYLFRHQQKMKSMTNDSAKASHVKEARVTLMLFVVAVTFLFSTLSESIYNVADISEGQTRRLLALAAWATLVLYDLYHSTNFIIYMIFLEQFRACFFSCFRRN